MTDRAHRRWGVSVVPPRRSRNRLRRALVVGPVTVAVALAVTLAVVALGGACEETSHRDIQDEINILTRRNDALVPPATERLARAGRLAIPQIETALHTAAPTGRIHLIAALDRLGDGDAIPVLRHLAVYDVRPEVRQACTELLDRWASTEDSAGNRARAERARAAQTEIARKRAAGEAPLIFDGGTPGAPTVGAPEPVGLDLEKSRR